MPARAAWKGYLQINQLQVPVKAFTACSTQPEITLNQLHRNCGERIQQQKTCPVHGVLTTGDIVSGYEFAEGQYLPIEPVELEALLPDDDKTISVDAFVDQAHIDPVYHSGRTYYVTPDGPPGQRPFCALREALQSTGRHGVARVVMARRTLLVLIRPMGRLVAMTVLEYPQRVRVAAEYEGEVAQLVSSPAEQQLFSQLIEAMTDGGLDLTRYEDQYTKGLTALIERRLADTASTTETSPITNDAEEAALVAALRASLTAAGVDDIPNRIPSRTERGPAVDNDVAIRKPA